MTMTSNTLSLRRPSRKGKRSSFYHVRWNKVGLNEHRAADLLGVTVEQIQEWDNYGNDLAERYLLLWDSKRINQPGWEGFIFTRGVLCKGKLRWSAQSLLTFRDQSEQIFLLQTQISTLKAEVSRLAAYAPASAGHILLASDYRRRS